MNPATATDWRGISVAFIAGIAAAIMLAKGSAAAPTIQLELDLQLAQIGWIMSISNLATLLFGTLSGQLSARFGLPHMVKTGLAVMTVAALASLLADSFPSILTGRAIEGIGVVLLTVAAPAWIASMSSNEDRAMAMGVWALWLPVGSIIIMLLSPLLMASGGWRALWLFSAVASALAWLLIRTPGSTGSQQSSGEFDLTALKRKGPWLLALVFACFSFQFFSVFTFLPIYFTDQLGLTTPAAATLITTIPLLIIPGNLFGGLLAKKGLPPWLLLMGPAIAMIVLTQTLFNLAGTGLTTFLILGSYGFFLGIIPTAIFVQAPKLATRPSAVAPIIGLGMSGQGLGILLGPPLTGWIAQNGGHWQACANLLSSVLVLLALMAAALAAATREKPMTP